MKMNRTYIIATFLTTTTVAICQERVGPMINQFGLIYPMPEATVKPSAQIDYQIVVDLLGAPDSPTQLNPALNNVARMLNLHVVGGAAPEKMEVVLAVHGPATPSLLNDEAYIEKYGVANPNTPLLRALSNAGVLITVCGQSMIARDVSASSLNEYVEIATSMLTTVTTYSEQGYTLLRF